MAVSEKDLDVLKAGEAAERLLEDRNFQYLLTWVQQQIDYRVEELVIGVDQLRYERLVGEIAGLKMLTDVPLRLAERATAIRQRENI